MTRPIRIDHPGAWHHVMNRVSGRRIVFRTDVERRLFVDLIAEINERYGVEVHCFCLMGTHFHLLVRSGDGRLSEAMQWLGSRFTRSVNAIRGVDGPIFRGRFRSILVARDAHLRWLFRYIPANVLDLGWTAPLGLYEWSSLGATVGLQTAPAWLETEFALGLFGNDPDRYAAFVEDARHPTALAPSRERHHHDLASDTATWCSDLADVESAIELASGFRIPCHSAGDQRRALALLAVEPGLAVPERTLAEHLGVDHASVSSVVSRARRKHRDDSSFRTLIERSMELWTAPRLQLGV